MNRWPYGLLAVFVGVLLASQGRVNGQLGAELRDGVLAAIISTGFGFVVLVTAVVCTPAGRRGAGRLAASLRERRLRWWECLGGCVGAYMIFTQGVTITALGVAVFTVATVSGQLVSSLFVDRAGIGPAGPQPITAWRLLGAGMAVGAVVLAVQGQFARPENVWLFLLPAVAGFGLAWQSAVNGQVRDASGNAVVAAMVNFGASMVLLVVATVVDLLLRGWPVAFPDEWWLYTGGAFGIFVIGISAVAVRAVGVLLRSLCVVAGQLLGAIVLDVFVPARGAELRLTEVLGTVITLFAVAVAAVPTRRKSALRR
ncbi:DMT family transporter [Kibdelosporangium persicum]|uniref:DMT family transporter n=1 Tax=Kibdelosporangium persicum TaxID=2698649 RepID=A0ABX2F199_9PSEU|nr:DMT family transporter [Kibdelosporangium persicum]NRN64635.1 DMT family transporter [Kibdelosporangium persicum]